MSSKYCFILIITTVFFACNTNRHTTKGVQSAMKLYDHYIQTMDVDSIALLYTPEGDLGQMAHGRDSVTFPVFQTV